MISTMDAFDSPMIRRRFEEVTATQSPTDASTQQTTASNYSNRNRSQNSTEPLLTTGEKIGAFIFGTITLMIGLYFLMIPIRVRRHRREEKPSRGRSRTRRRRPQGVAEREDEIETSATLTMLGESGIHDNHSGMPSFAFSSKRDDDNETGTKASTIEMASVYSLSSDDGSPSRSRNVDAEENAGNAYSTAFDSITNALLNVILPTLSKDDEKNAVDENCYVQHDDDDDNNQNKPSPFHPSPKQNRFTPPQLEEKNDSKFFMSNDGSVVRPFEGKITTTPSVNSTASSEDLFAGIREDDQPSDCESVDGTPLDDTERPFDCVA